MPKGSGSTGSDVAAVATSAPLLALGPMGWAAFGLNLIGIGLGRKKRKAQRRAAAYRHQISKIEQFQVKRNFMNTFWAAQSAALNQGALSGADLGSSGVQGTLASTRTQATTGMIELNEMMRLGDAAFKYDQKAHRYAGYAQIAGQAADVAQMPGISDWGTGGTGGTNA